MIDKAILDEVLPVPELEALKEEKISELKEEGFVITNFHSGGVFYTLLMVVLRIKIEFTELLRVILNNMFLSHASGAWLDLKAADYGKKRKKAQKTQGLVTLTRTDAQGEAVKIEKGHIFKTQMDINGEELRFFAVEAAVLQKGARSVDVLVEAEKEGARYNVPEAQITRSLTFLNGVDGISNTEDWVVREGSDTEDDEGLRTRSLRSWSELAARAIEDTFVNAAEAVQGVLFAQADCDHPRGQGTVDVIVTGTAGEATEGLLDEVREAVDKIAGPYDNILGSRPRPFPRTSRSRYRLPTSPRRRKSRRGSPRSSRNCSRSERAGGSTNSGAPTSTSRSAAATARPPMRRSQLPPKTLSWGRTRSSPSGPSL